MVIPWGFYQEIYSIAVWETTTPVTQLFDSATLIYTISKSVTPCNSSFGEEVFGYLQEV
jgi:hypothetical protein